MDVFLLILFMLALGYGLAKSKLLPANTPEVLNRVVLYLCLPASILRAVPQLSPEWRLAGLIAIPWLLALVLWPVLFRLKKTFQWRDDEYAALLICVVLGNTAFIGYPTIQGLYGDTALGYAVIYDQFGTGLLLSTFGLYLCARYSGGDTPKPLDIGKRLLKFPPMLALIAAVSVMPAMPPKWLALPLESLSAAMLPLVMLGLGFSLRLTLPRDELSTLAVGLLCKLALMPLVAWGLAWALGLRETLLAAAVMQSAMPTMITAAVIAIAHGLAPRLAAALTGYGTLLALVTLPLWHRLLG